MSIHPNTFENAVYEISAILFRPRCDNLVTWELIHYKDAILPVFSAANLALAGFPLTNALGESMPSRY